MHFLRVSIIVLAIFICVKIYDTISLPVLTAQVESIVDEGNVEQTEEREQAEIKNLIEDISAGEAQVLMHLSERHRKLQRLELELRDKEILIEAAKQYMNGSISQLQELQDNLSQLLVEYHKAEEEKTRSLVKIYENMKPQEAAQIFDELDVSTLLAVIDNMKEAKVAALLAKMRPEKARQITMKFVRDYDKLQPKNYNLCLCE